MSEEVRAQLNLLAETLEEMYYTIQDIRRGGLDDPMDDEKLSSSMSCIGKAEELIESAAKG